jgi:hypothetical protein
LLDELGRAFARFQIGPICRGLAKQFERRQADG